VVHYAAPQLGGGYSNARIAEVALQRLGQHGGQCKKAVNIWVAIASGGAQHLGGDYLANYHYEGGAEVARDGTVEGDVIQLNGSDGRYYYSGMHTAVVVSHTPGSDLFEVVDSNFGWDEIIREHAWNPYASAQAHGLSVHIWRMGSAGAPEPSPPGPTAAQGGNVNPQPTTANPQPPTTNPQSGNENPQPNPAPAPHVEPVFTVMNTDETPPDGIWFRNSPHTADTEKVTGLGVYSGEQVKLHCYGWGDSVGPYRDTLWYDASNVTRSTVDGRSDAGWLNAHYINDSKRAGEVDAGVPAC
jgi:hypothetical protein